MTIPSTSMIDPLSNFDQSSIPIVDPDTGVLTAHGMQMLQQFRDFMSGSCRVIPCDASGQNVISLTPVATAPKIRGYRSHDIFVARAAQNSTAAVTMTVVPDVGTLDTLKLYKSAGAAQAGSGDVVADSLYLFVYAEHLDSGAGGFVLK